MTRGLKKYDAVQKDSEEAKDTFLLSLMSDVREQGPAGIISEGIRKDRAESIRSMVQRSPTVVPIQQLSVIHYF